jgi:hypothetical protein
VFVRLWRDGVQSRGQATVIATQWFISNPTRPRGGGSVATAESKPACVLGGADEAAGELQVQQAGTMDELRVKLDELATNLKSLNTFRVVDIAVLPGPEVRRPPPVAAEHTAAK